MTLHMRAAAALGTVTRSFVLDDIRIRSDGDGRTVDAYAAVFGQPSEIHDQDGHYNEVIDPSAFNRTISHRGTKVGVFYNHGKTLYGTPSDRASVPLGTPLDIRADNFGVFTSTRYNKTELADAVLESIRNGDITGQSFTGRMLRSTPERGPYRARGGELTTVTRNEIALIEYGPTPFPAYETASIIGTRAVPLGEGDTLLQLILSNLGDADIDPIVSALTSSETTRDQARTVLSEVLDTMGTASGEGHDAYTARLRALADRLGSGTTDPVRASADSPADSGEHSAPKLTRAHVRARLHRIGAL